MTPQQKLAYMRSLECELAGLAGAPCSEMLLAIAEAHAAINYEMAIHRHLIRLAVGDKLNDMLGCDYCARGE